MLEAKGGKVGDQKRNDKNNEEGVFGFGISHFFHQSFQNEISIAIYDYTTQSGLMEEEEYNIIQ